MTADDNVDDACQRARSEAEESGAGGTGGDHERHGDAVTAKSGAAGEVEEHRDVGGDGDELRGEIGDDGRGGHRVGGSWGYVRGRKGRGTEEE